MWKYTHTDEMYHSLTGNNSSELFHSDTYLGQDFSDGIRHFKYIKREKLPNGKWRYYYSHAEYNTAKSAHIVAQKNYTKAYENSRKAQTKFNEKSHNLGSANLNYQFSKIPAELSKNPIKKFVAKRQNKKYLKEYNEASKEYDDAYWENRKAQNRLKKKEEEAKSAHKNYEKIEKKTRVQRAVGTGVVKAANKLSDASYAVGKKAKQTKKKLNKSVAKGKKAVNKVWDKMYTSPEEAKAGFKNYITGVGTVTVTEKKKKKKK
jgi:chaperonin cofactor prefoldin